MRVAILSAFPLFPTTEGNRSRILNLCRALRRLGHDVHVVYMPTRTPDVSFDAAAHVEELGRDNFHVLERPIGPEVLYAASRLMHKARRRLLRLAGSPAGYYFGLDELWFGGFSPQISALDERLRFDVAIVEYVFHSRALEAFRPGTTRVIDSHDSFTDRHVAFVHRKQPGNYWFSVPSDEEHRGFARADHVLAIQDVEADVFARRAAGRYKVWALSHLLQVGDGVEDFGPAAGLYIGSANAPNVASLTEFITAVLPRVVAARPDFRLVVAGEVGAHVPDHPAVDKIGRVDTPLDAFRRAPLLVNFMLVGTGISIKLLEAMAAGVPVVTTETGCRGLSESYRGGVVAVADDDRDGFCRALVALLDDEHRRREAGARARAAALTWNKAQYEVLGRILPQAERLSQAS